MSAHTPGPWKLSEEDTGMNDSGTILDPYGHVIVTDVYGRTDDEAEANARLIAAAPDLLAACKLILAGEADDDTILNAVADAVAKAGGPKEEE